MARAHGIANDWVTAGSRLRFGLCAGLNVQSGHREWAGELHWLQFLGPRAVLTWDAAH